VFFPPSDLMDSVWMIFGIVVFSGYVLFDTYMITVC